MWILNFGEFSLCYQPKRELTGVGYTSESGLLGVAYAGQSGLTGVGYTGKFGLPDVACTGESSVQTSRPANALKGTVP